MLDDDEDGLVDLLDDEVELDALEELDPLDPLDPLEPLDPLLACAMLTVVIAGAA